MKCSNHIKDPQIALLVLECATHPRAAAARCQGLTLRLLPAVQRCCNPPPLPRLIYPCRSLCEAVKRSCAPVMACYGYPWPEILNCNKFPADHELCITAVSTDENSSSRRSKGLFSSSVFPYVTLKAQNNGPMPCFHS